MSVPLTTARLFEILGTVYAEVRVVTEENVALGAEVARLTAALATAEEKPRKQGAK